MTRSGTAAVSSDESWLRLLIEAAPSPLLVLDGERKIALVSEGAEQLFGYRRQELLGHGLELLIPVHSPTPGREAVGRRKDGSSLPIELGLSSLDTPRGLYTLASVADLTALRTSQDGLRRSNDDLQQFASIVAHDLQEPLRMVTSYTELLAQRYQGQLDERADKYVHYAVDGAKRMHGLLTELLAYSRIASQGKPLAPVSAETVAKGVIKTLAGVIRHANASVQVGPLPTVLADEGQLRQLLQHLIGNALKFRGEAVPVVEISAMPLNDRWQFAIKDNGIGIDGRHTERIFQMFQRLHERGKYDGTGVGLAIAKRILERHGGRIWLESEPGVGSTFFFTLATASTGQP
jgi:light-regulated signal transduction histidine kinase (bacteriophytochrome)